MGVDFSKIEGFEWDEGNCDKNWKKHTVTMLESEEIFFNDQPITLEDDKHSIHEKRYAAFGKTDQDRTLTVVFTIRNNLIRVISARDMNKKERAFYEEKTKKDPKI